MPRYDYSCHCGHEGEYITGFEEYQKCPECGKLMARVPVRCYFNPKTQYCGYYNETLGKFINSETEQKEEMRRQGVSFRGDTPKPDGQAWV